MPRSRSLELAVKAIGALPQHALSRAAGRLACLELPGPLQRAAIRAFAAAVGVDWSEVRDPIERFASLQAFFTRALVDGARPLAPDPAALLSPCDGSWGASGRIERGAILQAKGRPYSLGALLGSDADAEPFEGGTFATLYLSPRDYHRFHAPCALRVTRARYLPGALWPVNRIGVEGVDGVFAENERICIHAAPDVAPDAALCVVAVGATLVGRTRVVFDPDLVTNRGEDRCDRDYADPPRLARGAELGRFEFGSTLVVLLPRGLDLDAEPVGTTLRMGTRIGHLAPAPEATANPSQ
jgi:phosphatidylserine decarboxylase